MITSCFEHMKNGLACKNKWGTISKEFKEIFDYMLRTKDNEHYNVGLHLLQGFSTRTHIWFRGSWEISQYYIHLMFTTCWIIQTLVTSLNLKDASWSFKWVHEWEHG